MPTIERFVALAPGVFGREDLRVHLQPRTFQPPAIISVDESWRDALGRSRDLFNGSQIRLKAFEWGSQLVLECEVTDYKTFVATNLRMTQLPQLDPERDFANPIGVSGGVITNDRKFALIERSSSLAEYPGHLDTVGGGIDFRPIGQENAGFLLPFDAMALEVDEELGLDRSTCRIQACLGLYRNRETFKPELVFDMRASVDASALHTQNAEVKAISLHPFTRAELSALEATSATPITPSCQAWLWAAQQLLDI